MDAAGHQMRSKGIIDEAVPGRRAEPAEPLARHGHPEVAPLLGAGVAGMEVAVIAHGDRRRIAEEAAKLLFDQDGIDAHVLVSGASTSWKCFARSTPCATMKASKSPVIPNTLNVAQVDVEYW